MLVAKPCSAPMVPNLHLTKDDSVPCNDPMKYKRFVEKLNYLIVTHQDIAFVVSVVRQSCLFL